MAKNYLSAYVAASASASTPAPAPAPAAAAASSVTSDSLNVVFDMFMAQCSASEAYGKGVSVSSVVEPSVMTDDMLYKDVAFWADPVTAKGKPMLTEFISDSGSSR